MKSASTRGYLVSAWSSSLVKPYFRSPLCTMLYMPSPMCRCTTELPRMWPALWYVSFISSVTFVTSP